MQDSEHRPVTVGETATYSVGATGASPLTYQWQKNGTDIPGATSESYTTPVTTLADDGALFTVTVSNVTGNVTSSPATLTVFPPVIITQDPLDQTIIHLDPVTFTVGATGPPPLAYQWQRNGVDIPGANDVSYTIPQAAIEDDGTQVLRVRVSGCDDCRVGQSGRAVQPGR